MAIAAPKPLSFTTLLKLGRVSNLPTVWTNVLAGTVLAGADWRSWRVGLVLLAMSLFYVGGMYLNDYFDRAIDAREDPNARSPRARFQRSPLPPSASHSSRRELSSWRRPGSRPRRSGSCLAPSSWATTCFTRAIP